MPGKLTAATSGGKVANRRDAKKTPLPLHKDDVTTVMMKTTTSSSTNANKFVRADLSVIIDGHHVTALVDTGADFSIMQQELADRLKKVKTPWSGPSIRSAGGQLMTPTGKCTARLVVDDSNFVATFVILPDCCKELILGMDFLREYGAVINIPERIVTFSAHP